MSRRMRNALLLQFSGAGDTTAPTVVITCDQASPTVVSPITFTYTWSEDVTGFVVGDAGIANGTKGTFTEVSASVYTLSVVPNALATVTATVAAGVCTDAIGNENTEATPLAIVCNAFLVDNFSDSPALAAGAVNGTAANPGPGGNRVVVDAESKMTTNLTELVLAGGKATPANGDPGIWWDAVSRAAGKCLMSKQYLANATGKLYTQWDSNQAGLGVYLVGTNAGLLSDEAMGLGLGANATNDLYEALVFRGTGLFKLAKGGGTMTDWTLAWVLATGTDASMYPGIANFDKVTNLDYVRGGQLGAPWNTDDGLATAVLAGSRSAGDTWTAEAKFLMYFTVTTLPASGSIEVRFRIQDADNYWRVVINSDGTYTLDEVATGSPTNRRSGTGITNGQRICIRAEASVITVWRGTTIITGGSYSTTSYNTQTAGKLEGLGTGGAVTRIEVWPFLLSGTAKAQLDALNHDSYSGFQVSQATMTNALTRLAIPNGETGNNLYQVVHPDVCRPNPTGKWNGYTYWMAICNYPESNTSKENPYIFVSDDMETWVIPAGGSNPIQPYVEGWVHADIDIHYDPDADALRVIYQETDLTTETKLFLTSSTDGITWSAPAEIFSTTAHSINKLAVQSPSFIRKDDGSYEMYVVDASPGGYVAKRWTCATLTGTWEGNTLLFNRTPYADVQAMWHLDVYLDATYGYLALVTTLDDGVHPTYLWLASSTNGSRWHIADAPLMYPSVSGWDNKLLYRGTIGIRTATGFDVIYSAKSDDGAGDWGAGRTQLTIPVV